MRQPFRVSLRCAIRGLLGAFRDEPNVRRELVIGALVLCLALVLPLETWKIIFLIVVVCFVGVVELFNTALERILNILKPQFHEQVRDVKDLMAGAVLLSAVCAFVVGLMLFGPYVSFLIRHV